jgi:DNA repair exonuclease SbcCD ATPase subunit
MDTQMDDEVPILDEENYSTWRIEMKVHLKEIGAGVWKAAIGGSVPLKNKSKFAAQREEKKNDALALKTILSGLSSSIKESMGQCTSAKDLWLKLEETYQRKKEDLKDNSIKNNEGKESPKSSICNDSKCDDVGKKEDLEDNSIKINEGKESPKTPDCNISKCDDVEYFSTSEEENLEIVCVELNDSYPMEEVEEELSELKRKVEWGLFEYNYDHCYIEYSYLSENTKRFLKKNQRHILKLKEMLKEQEESKKTQLEEKEEEIKRLKNEIEENKKLDDEIRKSLEVNVHLKTQIEEAKRVEELLKNQVNEKEESCHKLEAEVVDLRKKVEKSNKFLNSSTILNEILDSQRSPNDKSGLGYKKEATHVEASTSKKHEVSPSLSKDGNNVASQPSTQGKESFKRTKQGRHQEAIFTPQRREDTFKMDTKAKV